jgi:hypothetical protein
MKITQYNTLKEQIEQKYSKALHLAERQRSESLRAIETLWNSLQSDSPKADKESSNVVVVPPKNQELFTNQDKGYGNLTGQINAALKVIPEVFTKQDIERITGKLNENTVGCYLWKLAKQGKIKIIEKGHGRTPNKYKKMTVF